jgi:hypothetical protein
MIDLDLPLRPTSLKLPGALKNKLDEAAKKAGVSAHAYMIQALNESVRHADLRSAFEADCAQALDLMEVRGKGYELSDVRQHFSELAAFRAGQRARPLPLQASDLPR